MPPVSDPQPLPQEAAIDKSLVRRRFARAMHTYEKHATVQEKMAQKLTELAREITGQEYQNILELGCGSGLLTRKVLSEFTFHHFYVNDLIPEAAAVLPEHPRMTFHGGDAESLYFPAGQDLILSNAVFQWIEDLSALLRRLSRLLSPGGLLLFSTFGAENLREIRSLTGKGLLYKDPVSLVSSIPGLVIHSVFEELQQLFFPSPLEVLKHLKYTGVNALQGSTPWTKQRQNNFCEAYHEKFSQPQGLVLTYHPVYVAVRLEV